MSAILLKDVKILNMIVSVKIITLVLLNIVILRPVAYIHRLVAMTITPPPIITVTLLLAVYTENGPMMTIMKAATAINYILLNKI